MGEIFGVTGCSRVMTDQVTLGDMIRVLGSVPAQMQVKFKSTDELGFRGGLGKLVSYRGFYEDLAFEPSIEDTTAGPLLSICRDALGGRFEGYKGGGYVMKESTLLWISSYGHASGAMISGFMQEPDCLVLLTELD